MTHPAFFDESAEAVRFWVEIDGAPVGASIDRQTLHYRFCPQSRGEDHLETYRANATAIDAAVRRRIAQGSTAPVIVRDGDLREPKA